MTSATTLTAEQQGWLNPDTNFRKFLFFCVTQNAHQYVPQFILDGTGYDSLEACIATLPEPKYDVETSSRYIARDFGSGFGTHFSECGIVAWVGKTPEQKPFIWYTAEDGKKKWVIHPQVELLVKRVS